MLPLAKWRAMKCPNGGDDGDREERNQEIGKRAAIYARPEKRGLLVDRGSLVDLGPLVARGYSSRE